MVCFSVVVSAVEPVTITPDNYDKYNIKHSIRKLGVDNTLHTFEFPEVLKIGGEDYYAFSVVNVAYAGQEGAESMRTVLVPQYSSRASVAGDKQGLSVSFITVTYMSIKKEEAVVYSFSLNDWTDAE
jgi:hypothetical protein